MSKVLICGSRTCTEDVDKHLALWSELESLLCDWQGYCKYKTVIHGGARGGDTYAENIAKDLNCPTQIFKPDWMLLGKSAGFARNMQMLEQEGLGLVIALWDGKSNGTKNTIDNALKKGIDVRVIFFEKYLDKESDVPDGFPQLDKLDELFGEDDE